MYRVFRRDFSSKPEYALRRLLFPVCMKDQLLYVQGEYTNVLTDDVVLGRRVCTALKAERMQSDKAELLLQIGDALESIEVSADGIKVTTMLGDGIVVDDNSRSPSRIATEASVEGERQIPTEASVDGERQSRVSFVALPEVQVKGFEKFVTPQSVVVHLAASLESTRIKLRMIASKGAVSEKLKQEFQGFLKAFEAVAEWFLPLVHCDGVAVVSYVAALDKIGRKAARSVGFFLLRPWLGICSGKLELQKLRALLTKIEDQKTALLQAHGSFLLKLSGEDKLGTEVLTSLSETYISDNLESVLLLHTKEAKTMFRLGATDKVLTHLICVGNASAFDEVARADAEARGVEISEAMSDFAQRVPAIRLAIKHGHASVMAWLVTNGKLECINPPAAPSPRLGGDDHTLPTLDMAKAIGDQHERKFLTSLLTSVASSRRFTQTSIAYLAREPGAEGVTSRQLIDLAQDMTNVTQLSQLDSLAGMNLLAEEHKLVMLAAFEVVLTKELVKDHNEYMFFRDMLDHSCRGQLRTNPLRKGLKVRARNMSGQSARWARELQQAVSDLQVATYNLDLRLTHCENGVTSLQRCITAMQLEAAEASDRKRFVSIIAAVLSPICAPLHHAVDAWLDTSDPTRVLHMIYDISTTDEMRQFVLDETVRLPLQPGVREALQSFGLNESTVASGLRVVATHYLQTLPADAFDVPHERESETYVVPLGAIETNDGVDAVPILQARRRQLFEVVLDVIANMRDPGVGQ